jgi:5-formyltetrahydrofolate cyclo-ligase
MQADEVAGKSAACLAHLDCLPAFDPAAPLLAYAAAHNEVNTLPLLQSRWKLGLPVYLPRLSGPGVMEWVPVTSEEVLETGPHGVLTPHKGCAAVLPPDDAVCLVPCVLFSGSGHRLGHGGGHFDRFLAGFKGRSIALAYAWQRCDVLPVLAHDQPVNLVLTEEGICGGTETRCSL